MAKALLVSLLGLLGVFAALYAAAIGWLWFRQERLLFYPEVLAAEHRLAKEPGVQELTVAVPGATLSMLQLKLPDPKGVVFYLHGNGGSLEGWFSRTDFYRQANHDLVMLDYRGYGKSTGAIASEAQLRADVRAAWDHVAAQYEGKRVVVLGRSLGSALAAGHSAELTARGRPPSLTVLVSPYVSMRQMARELYPWVPPQLLRYPLETAADLARLRHPVLLIHGEADTLIGVHHVRQLHQAAPAARLLVIPRAGHNDLQEFPAYWQALARELAQP